MATLLDYLTKVPRDLELVSLEVTCGYQYYNLDGDNRDLEFKVPPFLHKLSQRFIPLFASHPVG